MNEVEPGDRTESTKSKSRGISCDMSSDAILRRLEIVDELRELAKELQSAKRIGPVDVRKD
ncbi:MAG: hypothetical protein U0930_10820 [Pirellulales bacterium]